MLVNSRVANLFKNLLLRKRVERDLDDELRAYVEMAADEKRSAGMTDADARRAALVELGGLEQVRESVRGARAGALLDQVRQDFFYACRTLRRNRSLTAVAATTLALGIGANTAIFSIVDTVVFRSLPYKDAGRLVKIWGAGSADPVDNVSYPDFLDIRSQSDVFEQVAADDASNVNIWPRQTHRQSIGGAQVTLNWLAALGVQPQIGRAFVDGDDQPGNEHVVLLTDSYWRHQLAADPTVVGRTMFSEDGPVTVIGVLTPNVLRYGNDFLTPLVSANYSHDRGHRDLDVFARLKPGVSIAEARAQLDTIARRLEADYPATNTRRRFNVAPLDKYYTSTPARATRALLLMFGAVGLVLFIACANVANLLLARAVTRTRECVIRAALGAGRARLIRQMLVESVVLFLIGGALGVLLARWCVDSLRVLAVAGGYIGERMTVAVDARVLAFTVTTSIAAGVLFGLVPALQASRTDLSGGLRASSLSSSGGHMRRRATRVLIVSELAISVVLLVGSGLMIRSFVRVLASPPGIDVENLVETDSEGGRSFPEALAFWRAALVRVRQDPGVLAAAVTSRPPIHGSRGQAFAVEGRATPMTRDDIQAGDILVSEEYFRTMGIPMVKGRAFTDKDSGGATPVVIISQSLARKFFPNEDPIGRRLSLAEHAPMTCCTSAAPVENVWREIVGVAADVRQANLEEQPAVTIYRPYTQIVEHDMYLMVRARSAPDAARLVAHLREMLVALDPFNEWADARLMREVLETSESVQTRRFALILLGIFAAVAILLAAVGTYGVIAYAVADRTREIGIRLALGAPHVTVLSHVLFDAAKLTLAGLLIGAIAAQGFTRFLTSMLFGISINDVITYVSASCILALVAFLASYLPARHATRVDPLIALRQE